MVFQPITYGGQYPPLKPRSSSDVNSFAALHASLRQSLPELAREGDRILNEEMLARFVDGVTRFQSEHLGRKSKSRYWPALRLPSPLLSDRKSYPNGPLGVMVLSAFRIKQVSAWRNFNFDNAKLFDDNVSIIKRMETDLLDRGYLRRPVIYFDASVERGLGKEELRRLIKIANRFGAIVLEQEDALASGRVTHVVAYDPEEHDADDVIAEERQRELGGDDDDDGIGGEKIGWGGKSSYASEKKFLRTLAVVDAPLSEDDDDMDDDDDGGVGTTTTPSGSSKRRRATRKMALVHWWYHPSSYDEWLPALDVPAAIEGDEKHGILPGGGACVVGCKFVRDVERFNEWGVEADYVVMDYERKVDCLRPSSVVGEGVGGSTDPTTRKSSGKGGKKRAADDDGDDDGEVGAAKRPRSAGQDYDDAEVDAVAAPASKKSKSKNSGGQVKTTTAAALGGRRQTSERRSCGVGGGGMNPRGILTGLRGQRGEVVRRTVHDGALRVEDEAHAVIRDALADYLPGPTPTLAARPEWRKLLPATGFVRPSVDASLGRMIVTELTLSEEGGGTEDAADASGGASAAPTLAMNVTIPILIPLEVGPGISVAIGCGGEEPLAMRGGGLEEDAGGDPTWQRRQEVAETVTVALPMEGEGNEVEAISPPEERCPSIGCSDLADNATENTNNMDLTDGIGIVDTGSIMDPCGDSIAQLREDDMHVEENEEGIQEEGVIIQEDQQPPTEMPLTESAINSTDAMQFKENSHSLSTAENVHHEVRIPTEDEQLMGQSPKAHQEVNATPPVMADDCLPHADAERESSASFPAIKPMEVDSPAAVIETNTVAASEGMDASTAEIAPATMAPPAPVSNVPHDVTNNLLVDKQPTETVSTTDTITAAQSHAASATLDETVTSNIDNQVTSSKALTTVAPVITEDASSKTLVATPVSSNSVVNAPSIESSSDSIVLCQVVSLPPNTHLPNTLFNNNPQSNEGDSKSGPERPSWYRPTKPSDFERRTLPEWFDCTAPHRTESSYIATREKILSLAKRNTQQFITSTAIRRSVVGDAGSLLRLHKFLMDYGLLNCGQIGETAPGNSVLRGLHAAGGSLAGSKRKHSTAITWTTDRLRALEASVVKHVSKKTVEGSPDQVSLVVDWNAVAADVGGGATALDCQGGFVHSPVEDVKISVSSKNSVVSNILNGAHPDVLKTVVEASLQSTGDINEARNASFVAVMASAAAQRGAHVESEIENTLMDIVDQRIQRLENRVALLDDVAALLEAERVSLELERRDMYTARCRHWFGDGSL